MKTIHKFKTPFQEKFTILMPKDAKILCVQIDQKTMGPCLWAEVEAENKTEERFFELFGTGTRMPEDMGIQRVYIGTYQYQNGEFVGHLYERIN